MAAYQSMDELVYQQVNYGNVEGIKALVREGAGLEYVDNEGRTPLILACSSPDLFDVAEALIKLGANVNAYRPGRHGGTPLHHAAGLGIRKTVGLLLDHTVNPFLMNDDCETALDLGRQWGHAPVVRLIEHHIHKFSGWMWLFSGPNSCDAPTLRRLSRKIWAVVLPCGYHNSMNTLKLELAIYPDWKTAQPIIALRDVYIEEPDTSHADPALIIVDNATVTRYTFFSKDIGDKQQVQWFYNECKGISPVNPQTSITSLGTPTPAHIEELVRGLTLNASFSRAIAEGFPPSPEVRSSYHNNSSFIAAHNGWRLPDVTPFSIKNIQNQLERPSGSQQWSNPQASSTSLGPLMPALLEELARGISTSFQKAQLLSSTEFESSSDNGNTYNWRRVSDNVTHNESIPWTNNQTQLETSAPSSHNAWTMPEVGRPPSHQQWDHPTSSSHTEMVPPVAPVPSAPPIPDGGFFYSPINTEIKPGYNEAKDSAESTADTKALCVICMEAPFEGICDPCWHVAGCMSCLNDIKTKELQCPICLARIEKILRIYSV